VETVHFVIATEDGMLVEAGAATPEDGGSWWRYETTVEGSTWLTRPSLRRLD
jgi:hypothetical protein